MTALDLDGLLGLLRHRRTNRDLDRLRGARADGQLVDRAQIIADRVVHLVSPDADRAVDSNAAERHHSHLAGAAAHVHNHPAHRFLDLQPRTDGRRDRLLDQVDPPRAGGKRRLFDGALFHFGYPRRGANDEAGIGPPAVEHLADEVAQHLLGDFEVGDHAVAQRPSGRDRGRGAPDHPLGVKPDRVNGPAL